MSMARVPGGTFKIENNMLVFEAEENSAGIDEFNSQRTQKFKEAADILNNQVQYVEGEFVGVCDSKERVFVAVNFPSMPSMSAEVYEISVQNPVKFLNLIEEQSLIKDNRVYGTFKRGTKILKICSSGKENAAILVEESQKKYVLLRVLTFQGENTSYDFERQWGKKWEMFSRTWYEYPIITDGEEKMVVDIKCDQDSCIAITDDGKKFECMFNSSFGVIDDGNQIKHTYKQVGHHSEWILKTNCGMLPTDITSDLPPYSGKAHNTNLQMEYKRDLVAMSNKSGVTGYGNQYLVDITTDAQRADEFRQFVKQKHEDNIKGYDKEKDVKQADLAKAHAEFMKNQEELKNKILASHALHMLMQKTANNKLNALIEQCEKIENELDTKQGQLGSYEEAKNNAQKNLDDAKANYNKILAEHQELSKTFETLEKQITSGGKTGSGSTSSSSSMVSTAGKTESGSKSSSSSMVSNTRSVQKAVDNKDKKGGSLFGVFNRKVNNVFKYSTKSANELQLEDLGHFHSLRNNRCAYV